MTRRRSKLAPANDKDGAISRLEKYRNHSIADLVALAEHLLNASFLQSLRGQGLTELEARVLLLLVEDDSLGMTDLASLALARQSTMTRAVERLERACLVHRRRADHDGRRVRLVLSEHGRRFAIPAVLEARRRNELVISALGSTAGRAGAALERLMAGLAQTGRMPAFPVTAPGKANRKRLARSGA